jgi:hypothetical protein
MNQTGGNKSFGPEISPPFSQPSNSASLSTAAFDPLCRLIPTAFKYRS